MVIPAQAEIQVFFLPFSPVSRNAGLGPALSPQAPQGPPVSYAHTAGILSFPRRACPRPDRGGNPPSLFLPSQVSNFFYPFSRLPASLIVPIRQLNLRFNLFAVSSALLPFSSCSQMRHTPYPCRRKYLLLFLSLFLFISSLAFQYCRLDFGRCPCKGHP